MENLISPPVPISRRQIADNALSNENAPKMLEQYLSTYQDDIELGKLLPNFLSEKKKEPNIPQVPCTLFIAV